MIDPQYGKTHQGQKITYGKPTGLGANPELSPDIFNFTQQRWMDIKPLSISGIADAETTVYFYSRNFEPVGYLPDTSWVPPDQPFEVWGLNVWVFNTEGILFYTDIILNLEELAALKTLQGAITLVPKLFGKISEAGRAENLARVGTEADQSFTDTEFGGAVAEESF